MQKTFLSRAENQTCYQADNFGFKRIEDWRFGPTWEQQLRSRFGRRHGPDLGPTRQAAVHERAAAYQVFSPSIGLEHLSAESFVGFDGSLWNGRSYAGLRGFFLPANARSRLRR